MFGGSRAYWEDRYVHGGDSGAGSSGRLAQFKAERVNGFVAEHAIRRVVEFGCGDGRQLSLANYAEYLGLDVSRAALRSCARRFRRDRTKHFLLYSGAYMDRVTRFGAELALSLDVVYHLVENDVYDKYMTDIFAAADRFVIIYSSNFEQTGAPHVRHREFTRWAAERATAWKLRERIVNRFPFDPERPNTTSHADFYIYERGLSP